jgi:hypothetical protein
MGSKKNLAVWEASAEASMDGFVTPVARTPAPTVIKPLKVICSPSLTTII